MKNLSPGIYLFVEFDWPRPFEGGYGRKARSLHDAVQNKSWIKEVVAGSGGLGSGPSSNWVFWLENYAALDRLLRDQGDEVCQAYTGFFSEMPVVVERIREEVIFL